MKKVISVLIVLAVMLVACGDTLYLDGYEYDTYGLFNKSDTRNAEIDYELIIGNIVWSVLLSETVVAPIYFIGWSLWEPVGYVDPSAPKGTTRAN